jgi:hypothetical protein
MTPAIPAASAPSSAPLAAPAAAVAAGAPAPSALDEGVSLSRLFEGTLGSTKSLLSARRPYDWQLVDSSGNRIAYVDLSKLLLTDQIGNYAGHAVVVLGSMKPVKESNDLVIEVEGFRLK